MIDLPWTQLSGAVAGGLVGRFSGFVANSFQERGQFRRTASTKGLYEKALAGTV
jgi:hypothetical protein